MKEKRRSQSVERAWERKENVEHARKKTFCEEV
jgi:hypothetical protein